MQFKLEFLTGSKQGTELELEHGTHRVGRDPKENDILFDPQGDRRVSAQHAQIDVIAADSHQQVVLRDLNSTNGTFVNGARVSETVLRHGDMIEFGLGGPRVRFEAPELLPGTESALDHAEDQGGSVDWIYEREKALGGSGSEVFKRTLKRVYARSKSRTRVVGWTLLFIAVVGIAGAIAIGEFRKDAAVEVVTEDMRSQAGLFEEYRDSVENVLRAQQIQTERLDEELEGAERRLASVTAVGSRERAGLQTTVDSLTRLRNERLTFQQIQAENRERVVLIFSELTLRKGADRVTVAGHGTGFVVDALGNTVTNAHVVEPWHYDLGAACKVSYFESQGFRRELPLVAVWKGGQEFRPTSESRAHLMDQAYATSNGRLTVVGLAPDDEQAVQIRDYSCTIARGETVKMSFVVDLRANPLADLALLRLAGRHAGVTVEDRTPAPLEPVMAFGYPLGPTALEGTLAVPQPTIGEVRKTERTIHHTAFISPGNSGGPLFSSRGGVLGVNSSHLLRGQMQNIAIPIRHAIDLLNRNP